MSTSVIEPSVSCPRCGIILSKTLPKETDISQAGCDARYARTMVAYESAQRRMQTLSPSSSAYKSLAQGQQQLTERMVPGSAGLCGVVVGTGSRCSRCGLYDSLPGVDHGRWCQRQREAILRVQREAQAMLADYPPEFPVPSSLIGMASLVDD